MGFKQSERAQNPSLRFLGQTDDLPCIKSLTRVAGHVKTNLNIKKIFRYC
jgi:hypothetical protein